MTPPPIASPHGEEPSRAKPPFLGLRVFVTFNAFYLLVSPLNSFFWPDPNTSQSFNLGFFAVVIPLWGALLWRLWHGSRWAWSIYWWATVFGLTISAFGDNDRHAPLPTWARLLDDSSYVFSFLALVWLLLPGVKAHFRRETPV